MDRVVKANDKLNEAWDALVDIEENFEEVKRELNEVSAKKLNRELNGLYDRTRNILDLLWELIK